MRNVFKYLMVLVIGTVITAGCSGKRTSSAPYGLSYCDGTIGSFDIYTVPNSAGLYEVYVVPVNLAQPGDIVKITIANKSLSYKELVPQVVAQNDQEIYAGVVSGNELQTYDIIAITPFESGTTFLQGNSQADAYCSVPVPGDNPAAR